MMKTFNQMSHSGDYKGDEVSVSITVLGGTYGGGSEVLVIERHFGSEVRLYEDVVPTLKKNMGDGGGQRTDGD